MFVTAYWLGFNCVVALNSKGVKGWVALPTPVPKSSRNTSSVQSKGEHPFSFVTVIVSVSSSKLPSGSSTTSAAVYTVV